jgi:hypothetical protein
LLLLLLSAVNVVCGAAHASVMRPVLIKHTTHQIVLIHNPIQPDQYTILCTKIAQQQCTASAWHLA